MHLRRLSAVVGAILIMVACSGIVDPSQNDTETFLGTIPFGGTGEQHTFEVDKTGEYSVMLNSLTPPTGSLVGMRLSLLSSGTCVLIAVQPGQVGKAALAGPIDKGTYCLQLYDPGTLAQTEAYSVTVSHP